MLIQIDFYKTTGKWYAGGRVEIDNTAHEEGIVQAIIDKQNILRTDWEVTCEFFLVVNDIPESMNDPNYRTTYARLYTPEQIQNRS